MKYRKMISLDKMSRYFSPALTSGSALNTCISLGNQGLNRSFLHFLVPSFLLFFGAPLYANLVYKHMVVDKNMLGAYFLGVTLYLLVGKVDVVRKACFIFPVVGRTLMLRGMCKSTEPLTNVVMWLIMNEFIGITLRKVFFGDSAVDLADQDISILMENILIVCAGRNFKLPSIFVVVCVVSSIAMRMLRPACMQDIIKSSKNFVMPRKTKKTKRQAASVLQSADASASPARPSTRDISARQSTRDMSTKLPIASTRASAVSAKSSTSRKEASSALAKKSSKLAKEK